MRCWNAARLQAGCMVLVGIYRREKIEEWLRGTCRKGVSLMSYSYVK
jgi:hypothetical protein